MLEAVLSFGTVTVFLFTLFLGLAIYHSITRPRGSPPGPPLLPFIGNLHLVLRKDTRNMFREMRDKYGDIYSLNFGYRHVIVMNGYDVLKEMFVKNGELSSERPHLSMSHEGKQLGIVSASGDLWSASRRFTLRKLRHFGFGSTRISKLIEADAKSCIQSIRAHDGEAFDIKDILVTNVSNVISYLLFSERCDDGDKSFRTMATNLARSVDNINGLLFYVFPFLEKMPWAQPLVETFGEEKPLLEKPYHRHLSTYQDGVTRDFTDFCIQEQKTNKGERDHLTEIQCLGIMRDIYEAGTETTTTAMLWILIHLIRQPEIQDRIRAEIDSVIGKEKNPSLLDRSKMSFTQATIMEVLRLENVVPFAVPHIVKQDLMFRGHFIPKSALIWPNLDSVVKDGGIWKDPEVFRPTRFIDETGELIKNEQFIPFSLGRRVCLGESMAMSMLFLFVTSMLQKFVFSPSAENEIPGLDSMVGENIHRPLPFKLRALAYD